MIPNPYRCYFLIGLVQDELPDESNWVFNQRALQRYGGHQDEVISVLRQCSPQTVHNFSRKHALGQNTPITVLMQPDYLEHKEQLFFSFCKHRIQYLAARVPFEITSMFSDQNCTTRNSINSLIISTLRSFFVRKRQCCLVNV